MTFNGVLVCLKPKQNEISFKLSFYANNKNVGYGHDRAPDSIFAVISDETIQLATKYFL